VDRKLRFFVILIILALCLGITNPANAYTNRREMIALDNVLPENTIIIANEMDARFSKDFSVLLKLLRVEWVILDNATAPDAIRDKNLVLIGYPDSPYTGELIQQLLTVEEIYTIQSTSDHPIILEKDNPWKNERIIYICSGADFITRRNAAEKVLRHIIASAPPPSDWIRNTYEAELDANLRQTVSQLQYKWEDAELPLQELTLDVRAKFPTWISVEEAEEDVERLFYLFSHSYSGYAFFNQRGNFKAAQQHILQELSSQPSWSRNALSRLLYKHLNFIVDCHLTIGQHQYAKHQDFWYDTQLEIIPGNDSYQFVKNQKIYTVQSINDGDPAPYILPSLNQEGEPVYRLGILSLEKPAPLFLSAINEGKEQRFKIKLRRSDFLYYSEDIFREDIVGGIPVVRIRSFGDYYSDKLSEFIQTATKYRDEAVIIVDVRGNGGGNEHWPVSWIQQLTGRRVEAVFAYSELESKTSMVGRLNAFNYWYHKKNVQAYSDEVGEFTGIVKAFESGIRQPSWTAPLYPKLPLIPNDTTVIVVTNRLVASAGEGLVMRISQVENVMVVGENTQGCLTFGNNSAHRLPNSGLMIWMPINFGLFPDQIFREEVGLPPDLWVPAADAVNYTVAALRKGTITTAQPLPQSTLEQPYTSENHWTRLMPGDTQSGLMIALYAVAAMIWAYFNRKKTWLLLGIGVAGLVASWYMIYQRHKLILGSGLLSAGIVYLIWAILSLWSAYRSSKTAVAT